MQGKHNIMSIPSTVKFFCLGFIITCLLLIGQTAFAAEQGGETQRTIRVQKILAHKKSRITKRFIADCLLAGKSTRVIIKLEPPAVSKSKSRMRTVQGRSQIRQSVKSSIDLVTSNLKSQDIHIHKKFSYSSGFAAQISSLASLEELLANDDVMAVYEDKELLPTTSQGVALIHGNVPRSRYDGSGISIAVLDTGIDYNHPMLGGGGFPNTKVIGGIDTGDDDADPFDLYGHGTAVAGIAAGNIPTVLVSDYMGGVAPGAKLYAVKISHSDDYGTPTGYAWTSDIIEAIEWCITHQYDDTLAPIMIANVSFGLGSYSSACDTDSYAEVGVETVQHANLAGITIFASSGNDGYTQALSLPACYSGVISVGAVYDADIGYMSYGACSENAAVDTVACYSNSSADLDLLAPGYNAYTTDTLGSYGNSSGDYDPEFGGTSASSPYSAGSAALLQSAFSTHRAEFLTPKEVRTLLISTGDLVTDERNGIAKPRVNLDAAISSFLTAGDVNGDSFIDIADPIDSLKVLTASTTDPVSVYSDINNDNRVGLTEALYGLRYVAGLVCTKDHIDVCTSQEECESADGFWYDVACHDDPSCEVSDLAQCHTQKECVFVGGFWLQDGLLCVADPTSEVEPNESEETANTIYLDVPVTGQLSDSTDVDTYTLVTTEPQIVDVSFSTTVTSTYWFITVHDEYDAMISRHDVGNNDSFPVALPDGGMYYFQVSVDSTHSSDSYTLQVATTDAYSLADMETEPNNNPEYGDALSSYHQMSGQLMSSVDEDWFSLHADSAQDISISFSTSVASTYWLLTVYDENQILISQEDVGNNGVVSASLTASGQYFIVVQADDIFSDDQYSLTVEYE